MEELVSVIIPVYNSELYVVESINSILNQSYKNIEIIVVNDGSTDNSLILIEKNFSSVKNIIIVNSNNQGQCSACNLGFQHSKGDLIKFFDSDDLLNETFIESQVKLIGGRKDVIISSKWGRFYNDDIRTFKLNPELVWMDMTPIDWLCTSLEGAENMMQCAIWLIPREVLHNSGLWNIELSLNNDFEFFVRVLLKSNKIIFSEQSILYYRSGLVGSLSQLKNRNAMLSGVRSNLMGSKYILEFEDTERIRKAIVNNLKKWMFMSFLDFRDLSQIIEAEIQKIHKKRVLYTGRKISVLISYVIGWKLVIHLTRLKRYFVKASKY